MGTWLNNDGLYIKYNTNEATVGVAGEFNTGGYNEHYVEVEILLTSVGSSAGILSDTVTIPNGARIQRVVTIAEVLADSAGDAAVLNVGLIDQDRTTELDYNGLLAAAPQADHDASGEEKTYVAGSTYAGALIGTTLTNTGLLTADYDTAAYTAGRLIVRVFYYIP